MVADFRDIVATYAASHRLHAEAEGRWFRVQRTLTQAIRNAALARRPSGKRFSHQRRIPAAALRQAQRKMLLVQDQLAAARTFHDLHTTVEKAIREIRGIGELATYDTALRLGAFLGLRPDRVYLHAGTRVGARQLGFDGRRKWLLVSELPQDLQSLSAEEAEDVLCIFKQHFGKHQLGRAGRRKTRLLC